MYIKKNKFQTYRYNQTTCNKIELAFQSYGASNFFKHLSTSPYLNITYRPICTNELKKTFLATNARFVQAISYNYWLNSQLTTYLFLLKITQKQYLDYSISQYLLFSTRLSLNVYLLLWPFLLWLVNSCVLISI